MRGRIHDGDSLARVNHLDEKRALVVLVGDFPVKAGQGDAILLKPFLFGFHRHLHGFKVLVSADVDVLCENDILIFINVENGLLARQVVGGDLDFHWEIVADEGLPVVDDVGDEGVGLNGRVASGHGVNREFQFLSLVLGIAAGIVDAVGNQDHRAHVVVCVQIVHLFKKGRDIGGLISKVGFEWFIVTGYFVLLSNQVGLDFVFIAEIMDEFIHFYLKIRTIESRVLGGCHGFGIVDGEDEQGFVALTHAQFEHGREQQDGDQGHGNSAQNRHHNGRPLVEVGVPVAEIECKRENHA